MCRNKFAKILNKYKLYLREYTFFKLKIERHKI